MQFRSFVKDLQQDGSGMSRRKLSEGTFRSVVDATRQQKAREEQEAAEQGQIVQQASVRHSLQQAVEKCSEVVEFVRAVEEAVQTGDLSAVQARATTMRGVATGLLQLLRGLVGSPHDNLR